MNKSPFERSTHPSQEQTDVLLQYLEQHPELARGFPKLPAAKERIKKHWEYLTPVLNEIGTSVKTWQQWTKYWSDKKSAVKKKAALREKAVKAGKDPDTVMELTEVEQRILSLLLPDYVIDRKSPVMITYDNTAKQIKVCDANPDESLLIERPKVVFLMSPATLPKESSMHSSSPLSAAASRSPSPVTPPSVQPAPCQETLPPAANTRLKFRKTGVIKQQHRGHLALASTTPREPHGQRRSKFATLTDRFLRLEEQRLELDRRNSSILETVAGIAGQLMERDFERERVFAQALSTVGEGLKLLAEALKKKESMENT